MLGGIGNANSSLNQRFYIAEPDFAARYYDELQQRFQKEWPEIQPVDTAGQAVPKPVVAVTASGALAGGLAFAAGKAPLSEAPAVWINAVLVEPEYRHKGLGSQLILAAQESAGRLGISRLYALTELPALYSKLNWAILSSSGADFIMTWDSLGVG
jgi:GNAT superfamily N-acetyltransferase